MCHSPRLSRLHPLIQVTKQHLSVFFFFFAHPLMQHHQTPFTKYGSTQPASPQLGYTMQPLFGNQTHTLLFNVFHIVVPPQMNLYR
jgi:hypothetical protein